MIFNYPWHVKEYCSGSSCSATPLASANRKHWICGSRKTNDTRYSKKHAGSMVNFLGVSKARRKFSECPYVGWPRWGGVFIPWPSESWRRPDSLQLYKNTPRHLQVMETGTARLSSMVPWFSSPICYSGIVRSSDTPTGSQLLRRCHHHHRIHQKPQKHALLQVAEWGRMRWIRCLRQVPRPVLAYSICSTALSCGFSRKTSTVF